MGEPENRAAPLLDPAERLHLLVDFATVDLAALEAGRPGDRINLIDGLARYTGDLDLEDAELRAAKERPTRLRAAQAAIRELVDAIVNRTEVKLTLKATAVTFDATEGRPGVYLSSPGGKPHALKNLLLHIALEDFRTSPFGDRIRRCKREKCARVFFAERPNAEYCDRRCSSRAGVDAYLERQKVKAAKMRAEGLI